jgi:lysophospholipase L1-like esterase
MKLKIHIALMGDSLTVGFIPSSLTSQPYSDFLKEYIDNFLKKLRRKNAIQIRITNRGVNGDLTGNMLLRFKQDVVDLKPDYVIVLGGANDIGWGFPVENIFSNLRGMFETAMANGICPTGCTLPSVVGRDEGIPPRLALNKLLMDLCNAKNNPCVDLFAATCDRDTKRLRYEYSSDGLHLNTSGYRKIAETIFEESVKDLILKSMDSD